MKSHQVAESKWDPVYQWREWLLGQRQFIQENGREAKKYMVLGPQAAWGWKLLPLSSDGHSHLV